MYINFSRHGVERNSLLSIPGSTAVAGDSAGLNTMRVANALTFPINGGKVAISKPVPAAYRAPTRLTYAKEFILSLGAVLQAPVKGIGAAHNCINPIPVHPPCFPLFHPHPPPLPSPFSPPPPPTSGWAAW